MRRLRCAMLLFFAALGGCGHRKEQLATDDRVNIRAPFVNVRVGENGGASVRAPFTNVETDRYTAGQPNSTVPAPPAVSTGNSAAANPNWQPIR